MWVLYNVAHKNCRIKSPDEEAWLRVLGFFSSKEVALNHAKQFKEEVRISECNQFKMLTQCPNAEIEIKKHDILLKVHDEVRKQAFEDTRKNAEQRKMGSVVYKLMDRLNFTREKYGLPLIENKQFFINDTCTIEVRMQKFCAIALLPDYENMAICESNLKNWEESQLKFPELKHLEPGIKFLVCGNTQEEIQLWIKNNCDSPDLRNFDIACISMYEWLKVIDGWNENIKRTFREQELNKLYENKEINRIEALKLQGKVKEIEIYG